MRIRYHLQFDRQKLILGVIIILLLNCSQSIFGQQETLYYGTGNVSFISDAPIEQIVASSSMLSGVIDISQSTFAFTFPVNTFEGFNSPLQKEHFNEHYLETEKFPNATFSGKIMGFKSCGGQACEQTIKAKGLLVIHGVTKVVTLQVILSYNPENNSFSSRTNFDVVLEEFEISVPLILAAKIAPIIKVSVDVKFSIKDE